MKLIILAFALLGTSVSYAEEIHTLSARGEGRMAAFKSRRMAREKASEHCKQLGYASYNKTHLEVRSCMQVLPNPFRCNARIRFTCEN